MPPFKLEFLKPQRNDRRNARIVYTKNAYTDGVKVEDWEKYRESKPIDNDPYCPGKVNYFLSHYNRLGVEGDEKFATTTAEMLQQVFIKDTMVPDKHMANYYTFDDKVECPSGAAVAKFCPEVCASEFLTTMQHSYQTPHPYAMQRIAFPRIPFMQNRKYKKEDPYLSEHKFYDEGFHLDSCNLRKYKGFRWTSYNPATGDYT